MLEEIKLNLMVNLQIEQREGQNIDRTEKGGAMTARACRKQFKETAELVMAITEELEGKK